MMVANYLHAPPSVLTCLRTQCALPCLNRCRCQDTIRILQQWQEKGFNYEPWFVPYFLKGACNRQGRGRAFAGAGRVALWLAALWLKHVW